MVLPTSCTRCNECFAQVCASPLASALDFNVGCIRLGGPQQRCCARNHGSSHGCATRWRILGVTGVLAAVDLQQHRHNTSAHIGGADTWHCLAEPAGFASCSWASGRCLTWVPGAPSCTVLAPQLLDACKESSALVPATAGAWGRGERHGAANPTCSPNAAPTAAPMAESTFWQWQRQRQHGAAAQRTGDHVVEGGRIGCRVVRHGIVGAVPCTQVRWITCGIGAGHRPKSRAGHGRGCHTQGQRQLTVSSHSHQEHAGLVPQLPDHVNKNL